MAADLKDSDGLGVEEGSLAPDFTLTSDSGERISLQSLRGKPVVLYFYPRDDTPGCTKQASGIRDAWGEFEKSGAVVLGISPDGERSHAKFRDKYELPFTLLADEDHAVAETYGTWVQKSFAGKNYMGVERSTFIIDPRGIIKKVMRRVNPETHADDVLAALR
jgi:thioredoxin-dependent peroxiredoxin